VSADVGLRGIYVPLITPFDGSGAIALDALERLGHEYLDSGAAGLLPLGTTGESPALDADEKRAVIDLCARICRERNAPVIVGAGTNNTRATVAAVEALASTSPLTAILVVVPYYVRPSDAGIVEHFRAVAAAAPAPLVIYNIPYRTGKVVGAAAMAELAAIPNIAGVKQAVGGVDSDTLEILAAAPPGFSMLCGDDPYIYPMVLMGATGGITASAHVCTERFVAMVECGLAGKVDEGRAHAEALLPVVKSLFAEPNPAVTKGVLHAQGRIPTPDLRLPMTAASEGAIQRALVAIDTASR
jgi:4-hydroxy-tetrahydrodipicolinate synthase